jgi:hypothetical protein
MKMFNTTLEKVEKQFNSVMYVFLPGQETDVPDNMLQFIEPAMKDLGVVAMRPEMSAEELKEAKRQGLIAYVKGALRERIVNFIRQEDEFKKNGVTLEREPRFQRALRWEKEIMALLKMEKPIEEELSFLTHDQRKEIGIDDARIEHFAVSGVFNVKPSDITVEPAQDTIAKRGPCRPKATTSFSEIVEA